MLTVKLKDGNAQTASTLYDLQNDAILPIVSGVLEYD